MNKNILVIDDDIIKRLCVVDTIKSHINCNIKEYKSISSAYSYIKNNIGDIDLIISDMQLPMFDDNMYDIRELGGLSLVRKIRRLSETDIIIVSSIDIEKIDCYNVHVVKYDYLTELWKEDLLTLI